MTELRTLTTLEELHECVRLQRTTWGAEFSDVVPTSVLQVSQKVGGFVGGAFEDQEMVGFVYSLYGKFERTLAHWSHMLAVHPSARGKGLGRRLKLFQRDALLADGIDTMFWTFDPLVARNAHLNLNRLGASILRYVPNMYGGDTGSPLHAGGDTDRFIVRWDLQSQRTRWAIDGELAQATRPPHDSDAVIAGPEPGAAAAEVELSEVELPEEDEIFIEVPADVASSTEADVRRWRSRVRQAFLAYLRRGYAVQSLVRDVEADRCYYFLRRS